MSFISTDRRVGNVWVPISIGVALLFLYYSVIVKLTHQWWNDDNYSHGLLIPFVIGLILWQERGVFKKQLGEPNIILGGSIVLFGIAILAAGTLGAELFSQRFSLVLVLAGIVVYFGGGRILRFLAVPFLLLLIAIPIPQIILNKVSFPLQLLATRAAEIGINIFGISTTRRGNVIELVPFGSTTPVGLEVVEACSGIRSLVTLVTLAIVLVYFSRTPNQRSSGDGPSIFQDRDLWRCLLLIALAIPIALATNALRVLLTGLATYRFGPGVAESWWHDAFGWFTYILALLLLLGTNLLLARYLANHSSVAVEEIARIERVDHRKFLMPVRGVLLFMILLSGGILINYFQLRTEAAVPRKPLSELPLTLGGAFRPYNDTRFSPATEEVLKASDYIMRDYILPPRRFNLYVGYYTSQQAGATYHSPQHCLPGSGWDMSDGRSVEFKSPAGKSILASRYLVRQGAKRYVMVYWYQGRGRTSSSEYWDKIYTIIDSVSIGRSDGAMVRVMTPVYSVESDEQAFEAVKNFSGTIADSLTEFVPD